MRSPAAPFGKPSARCAANASRTSAKSQSRDVRRSLRLENLETRTLMSAASPFPVYLSGRVGPDLGVAVVDPLGISASMAARPRASASSNQVIGGYVVQGAILTKYLALGGARGFLGNPITNELKTPDGIGRYNHFQYGSIYWTPSTGAHEVHGAIRSQWAARGWERGLGYPTTDELKTPDGVGRYQLFQNASIYWSPASGAHEVHGAIRDKWGSLNWEKGLLGYPLTDELKTPDGIGRYNHFQRGSIYWTPSTGAHEVHGAIRDKWASLGWERGLGYPTTDELKTPDGVGRYQLFQNASIYWSPSSGAHEVHGAIRTKWAGLNWEKGLLGYPTTDESKTPDGVGRYNHFQNGSIYWSPSSGAHEVHGAIRDKWASLGWERSALGYPTSDEYNYGAGRRSDFQRGSIVWDKAGGARVLSTQSRQNYVVLFAGGVDAANNHVRYYNNIKSMYQTITTQCNVKPQNVYVIYADGTSPGADCNPDTGGAYFNSNMSYAAGAHVLSATKANLLNTLSLLKNTVTTTDQFLFYSFDHGGGATGQTQTFGEEVLCGWGENIRDDELAPALNAVTSAHSTYVFTQCFAGGMLDDLMPMPGANFGCSATNHYESSWGDGFAAAFVGALKAGYRDTSAVFQYARQHDPFADTAAYAPNQGTLANQKEHPWSTGSNFPIFVSASNALANAAANASAYRAAAASLASLPSVHRNDILARERHADLL